MAIAAGGASNVYAQRDRDSILVERTCNGRFAAVLENRVQREASEGDIDRDTAWRMHREIDRLEDKGRHECSEGDWRAARGIGENYMRISRWIDSEAGRPQRWDDDRRGW
ncbi:hypothetical protein OLX02_00580 [Novosphingobium sp. KCTC 2891]|uniref:hypothetical protein n=1 Tax=Novosphingobium sp. KCTC 2891 TaxID=2989730 RepID=UPI002221547C|nr:hypothetical protein [Novosphingobium sp. KCTC 2891]MCW1381307.1 hypothetical protein [Novosphingobium sp. KCTC 2891]